MLSPHSASSRRHGFTLLEIVSVTAIIAILAAILVPTLSRVRDTARQAKCMGNVRQITLGLLNAANRNKELSFPANLTPANTTAGAWAWNVSHSLAAAIAQQAGRDLFYCPASPTVAKTTQDQLWLFDPSSDRGFAVTSYVLLVPNTAQISPQHLNDRVRSAYEVDQNGVTSQVPASQRPLVVDGVISSGPSPSSFAAVGGGLPGNLSNHMQGNMPRGAHTGYVDGHVKWAPFVMFSQTNPDGYVIRSDGPAPKFWF